MYVLSRPRLFACTLLAIFFSVSTASQAQQASGTLGPGDNVYNSGEYNDIFEFHFEQGQQLDIKLSSNEFDTYLVIKSPSGESSANDDAEQGNSSLSAAQITITETGICQIIATSYKANETGAYNLVIQNVAPAPEEGTRIEHGTLRPGDDTLTSGEFTDSYSFAGQKGDHVTIELTSAAFDTYLICKFPDGETQLDNDDHDGESNRSLLAIELPESGEYEVLVTSYKEDLTGEYTLRIVEDDGQSENSLSENGSLGVDDEKLRSGEFADTFSFEGRAGQRAAIDIQSSEFDTFLIVSTPSGELHEVDDSEPGHSTLDLLLKETGTFQLAVTSYEPGETGAYRLTVDVEDAEESQTQRDVSTIALGEEVVGELEEGDSQFNTGEYRDVYVFDGTAGEAVRIEMNSTDLDPYISMVTPGDDKIHNDDFGDSTTKSRIDIVLPETGRYRISATTYEAGESGRYIFSLNELARSAIATDDRTDHGRLFGVFVGISEYPDDENYLSYTADDATKVRDALVENCGMRESDGIVLTNDDAETGDVAQAIRTLGEVAGPEDTFVFFFSGHGSRYDRDATQPSDPDGVDESLEFYNGPVLDDDFSELLDDVGAGTQLIILDSCFSGGFSKDVISKPGRMGIFSSEEDVTSSVAAKFRAGGYLAKFFVDAMEIEEADEDTDGAISALELSHYIQEMYRVEVKGSGDDDIVSTSSRQLGYQKVVVDRGSIRPFTPLFFRD